MFIYSFDIDTYSELKMTDDKYPKDKLQTKLFTMGVEAEKAIENHYTAIGKITYMRTPEEMKIPKIAEERELIRFFEGQKNGLSLASNEVRLMIPEQSNAEKIGALGLQLANWVNSSGLTEAEFKECKSLASKIIKENLEHKFS